MTEARFQSDPEDPPPPDQLPRFWVTEGQSSDSQIEELCHSYSDVEQSFTEFQQHRTIPPLSMQVPLNALGHSLMSDAIEKEDYELAKSIKITVCELNDAFQHSQLQNYFLVQTQSLESRLEKVRQKQLTCELNGNNGSPTSKQNVSKRGKQFNKDMKKNDDNLKFNSDKNAFFKSLRNRHLNY
jgi:hypothetical protein